MIIIYIGLGVLVLFFFEHRNRRGRVTRRSGAIPIQRRHRGLLRTLSLVIVALSLVPILSYIGVVVFALLVRPFDSPGYQPDGSAVMGILLMSFLLSVCATMGLLKPLTSRR